MKPAFRPRWLLVVALAALGFVGTRLTANWLLPSAHQRLIRRYTDQIQALPEAQAARLIGRLAQQEDHLAAVLIAATADDRPLVADAAQRALRNLVLRWTDLSEAESSPRAARLARALASVAPDLPQDRRSLAKSIAQQLIVWPLDGRDIDTAQFIADCETVLLLPVIEPIEIRVAAAPRPPEEPVAPPPAYEPLPTELPAQSPPAVVLTENPPPTAASPPPPGEPQRFVPGRTLRISDD